MPAHRIPVQIKITDPALFDFGGPPKPATSGAAASDLVALGVFGKKPDGKPDFAVRHSIEDRLRIEAWEIVYIDVGFSMDIMDPNYAAHIIPRSSSSVLNIGFGNTIGLADSDFQGPLLVALWNRNLPGDSAIEIRRGERIAQMYFAPVVHPEWEVVEDFSRQTARGAGGFGSTGR